MASGLHKTEFKGVIGWVDQRLPIFSMLQNEYGVFPTPKNFNYFWNFGALAMFMLIFMIATGLFLAMNYAAHTGIAFDSVERIMRDVNFGWLLRYGHANGASMFFVVVYVHIFRGLYYGSYKTPRELLWILGVTIFLLMMATAFMGYVLPWGQMSFWGATVITNLFSAIPLVGNDIVTWLWGGFSVDNPTLNRFFALHFLMPFVIVAVVFLHVWALHITGSNNPLGIEPKTGQDTLPFHPYYTSKDIFGLMVFLIFFAGFVFFAPNFLGHPDNYIPANPMVTPSHIVPEWYFLPFYAILRAVPNIAIPFTNIVLVEAKLAGVLGMFGAIAVLFIIPWVDRSPIRSARFRPAYRFSTYVFLLCFALLGMAGSRGADDAVNLGFAQLPWVYISRAAAAYYFLHFTAILWAVSMFETRPTLPNSIHEAVLEQNKIKASKPSRKPWVIARVLSILFILMFLATIPAWASGAAVAEPAHPHKQDWPFNGPTGTFDRASLQRGFQVYKEVCSACHGMHLLSYRNLQDIGLSELQVKAIAAQYNVTDGPNDEGDMFERPARPSDRFKGPFANEKQARNANNGAYPPDMSLLAKARHDGSNYIFALLNGYSEPPKSFNLGTGMHYNKYFAGRQIAMTPPLVTEGQVTYADGTKASIKQMAWDVTQFLTWVAEPKMEERKRMGIKVILFLAVFAGIMYGIKRKIWRDVEH